MRATAVGVVLVMAIVAAGCGPKADVTPAKRGPLARFDPVTLSQGEAPGEGADVSAIYRCTFQWDGDDEGYVVDVTTTSRTLKAGGVTFVGVFVTTQESDCALQAAIDAPVRHYVVQGVPEAQVTLTLAYQCPSGQGQGGLRLSTARAPEVVLSGMSCAQTM